MKKLTLLIAILLPFGLLAQQQLEDVVYLKDGSIYRGIILEQVPNENLKIQIMGGSVVVISADNVSKMAKEAPFGQAVQEAPSMMQKAVERMKEPFEPRLKGYFFQGQVMLELGQFGMRVVNGYKFGRFGHLGIGVGIDGVAASPFNEMLNGLNANDLSGAYFPLYVYYAGDILKSKITPFYAIEAGYAFAGPSSQVLPTDDYLYEDIGYAYNYSATELASGGAMGSVGLGVRFNTRRRVNFSLLLNVNFKNVNYDETYYLYDEVTGYYDSYGTRKNATLLMAGMRFGVGF